MVNPYYGNSLYSGLAGNTHQPLQLISTINMQAKRIETELVPYIIYICMVQVAVPSGIWIYQSFY